MTEAYPLAWPDGWPRTPANSQRRSLFKTTFSKSCNYLYSEVRMMGGKHIVLSTNVPLRQDGLPYAGFNLDRMEDQGAAIYFQLNKKPIAVACDKWWRVHENVHALFKTIEALRGIERWGASELMHRAFDGFIALPPPGAANHWTVVLGVSVNATREEIEAAFKSKAKLHHPDMGGDPAQFNLISLAVKQAREQAREQARP